MVLGVPIFKHIRVSKSTKLDECERLTFLSYLEFCSSHELLNCSISHLKRNPYLNHLFRFHDYINFSILYIDRASISQVKVLWRILLKKKLEKS